MGPNARLRLIYKTQDWFIAGHENCALRQHLDIVPQETPIRDIVDTRKIVKRRRGLYRYTLWTNQRVCRLTGWLWLLLILLWDWATSRHC